MANPSRRSRDAARLFVVVVPERTRLNAESVASSNEEAGMYIGVGGLIVLIVILWVIFGRRA